MNFGNKPAQSRIVALHGFFGLAADWGLIWNEPFRHSYAIEALDLWPSALQVSSTNGFKDWCREFYSSRALKDEKPVLLGYSMGGRLAMHAAIQEPHRWSKVVFVSAHPGLKSEDEKAERFVHDQKWAARFRGEPWSEILNAWNAQNVLKAPSKEMAPEAIGYKPRKESDFNREALAFAMERWSLGLQSDLRDDLKNLSMPTLFITGDQDDKFTKLIQELELPSHHRHQIIADAGHRAPWEQPTKFRRALEEFIEKAS